MKIKYPFILLLFESKLEQLYRDTVGFMALSLLTSWSTAVPLPCPTYLVHTLFSILCRSVGTLSWLIGTIRRYVGSRMVINMSS